MNILRMKPRQRDFLSAFLLLSFILQYSFASKPCNDFVDDALKQLKEDEFVEEPYKIPEGAKSFGIYNVESGYIYGLNTLHRNEDAIPMKQGTTHLKIYLVAGEINIKCSVKQKVFHVGKPIDISANIPYVSMQLKLVPERDGQRSEIVDFKIDEMKGLTIKASGLGPISNVVYNAFLRLVTVFFKGMVRNELEDRLKNFLKNKPKELKIPVECLNAAWD